MNTLAGMFNTQAPMSKTQGIGRALAGFGAGVQGRGGEYLSNLQAQDMALDEQRRKAMAQDAMSVYRLLNDNDIEGAINLTNKRISYIQELGGDPSDTIEIRDLLSNPETLDIARQELGLFVQASMENGLLPAPAQPEMIKAGDLNEQGQAIMRMPDGRVVAQDAIGFRQPAATQGYKMLTPQEASSMGLPADRQYQVNTANNQITAVGGGGGGVSVPVTIEQPGGDKYVEGRATAQATQAAELEKAAESAYRSNQALDRFIESSASGDAGAAQPVITGVKNLLSSFGINPEGLTDTLMMEQAIGDILANRMSELGARGLTDRDMQVLRESLPRVATSHEARVMVANVIQKANMSTLKDYNDLVMFEQETYPDARFRRPAWLESVREQGFTVPEMAIQPQPQQTGAPRFTIEVVQ
jgi:hypothetical protein